MIASQVMSATRVTGGKIAAPTGDTMNVSVMDILSARDRRAATQKRLLDTFGKPLICFTMNIAGPVKYSEEILRGYQLGKKLLQARVTAVHFEESLSPTGCEGFFVVDTDATALKKICVAIEDSQALCRLFDMDVLDIDGRKLSREELNLPGRKCLLCDNPAPVCASTRAHSVAQLQQKTAELLETANRQAYIASLAYQALVEEVRTTPKPGLVDEHNSGSHKDMDLQLFLKSAGALREYFYRAAGCEDFDSLRKLGIAAEKAMLAATGGVNTHKGAIFTMGILCAFGGDCASQLQGIVEKDLGAITEETAVTAGQRLYIQYGITGIRGQAEQGFPAVKAVGLPILRQGLAQGLSLNDAGCAALLHILCAVEDTNLIARSDLDTARTVKQQLAEILAADPFPARDILEQLDRQFIEKNLSPGGSADLLAATYFLHFGE